MFVSDNANVLRFTDELQANAYPGRGLMLGCTPNADTYVMVYFIMGRSENSRNRVFVPTEDGIRTEAFDPSKCSDPSLIIYHPVRVYNGMTIITNGDQTDTIRDALAEGKSYIDALRTRRFQPDDRTLPHAFPRYTILMALMRCQFSSTFTAIQMPASVISLSMTSR